MNKLLNIKSAKGAFYASLFFAAAVLAFLAPKSAVNVDEQLHYPHAQKVVNWYFTGGKDISCLETPVTNLKYYGQSVDNLTALINRVFEVNDEFLVRHFTGAVFFWILLLLTGLLAYRFSGSYSAAALSVVTLLLMPRLFGQAFGNLKDIPFAAGYVAGILLTLKYVTELPKPRWSTAILLGISIAFTISVRIGGLILFGLLGLALIGYISLRPFLLKHIVSTKLCLERLLGQGTVILGIGYFGGLLFWPFALQDVLRHPFESLQVMEHYKVSIRQIFEGSYYWSTDLPWYYLPKWLLMATPEFVFLGFAVFLLLFISKLKNQESKQLFTGLFLFFTLFFPIVYVIAIKSNLYSGIRQMLFVMPVLAIFSSVGIIELLKTKSGKTIKLVVTLFFFGTMVVTLVKQIQTFPANYIYFNSVSGGNKKAWSNYEYDYYFHGMKKASEYLAELSGDEKIIVATNCNLRNYFDKYPNIQYQYARYFERSSVDWDYALFGVNYIQPELLKNEKWKSAEIIKTFFHLGNPVVVLLKRKDKSDFYGISEIEKGNVEKGVLLLETALKADPNNMWLYAQLAKKSLNENDFESFIRYLQGGREIYPLYEPFYLLEAQYFYLKNEYKEAKTVLNKLMEINPRYNEAADLLNAVNEKLKL